jgi:hypothetical protein
MIKTWIKFTYNHHERSIIAGFYNPFKESSKIRFLYTPEKILMIQFLGLYFSIVTNLLYKL